MRSSIRGTLTIYGLTASLVLAVAITTFATATIHDVARIERATGPHVEATATQVRVRLRGLLVFSLGAAFAVGLGWAWLASRVVLAPLRALANASLEDESHLVDAMDEVDAIARSFRRVVRTVRDEKATIEQRNLELAALQSQLAQADKLASLGTLAAGVAHDIGNPLAAIVGYLHILRSGVKPETQAEVLDRCLAALERINASIKDMLRYARPESDETPTQELDVRQLVRDTVDLLRLHPALQSVTIERIEPPAGASVRTRGRAAAFAQIVSNLVINAGHAVAASSAATVSVEVGTVGDHVEVTVADNGPGVPDPVRARIFDAYFSTRRPADGTGLGLFVSRALAQEMGGSLTLDESGEGARFRLRLPRMM
jgi:signal transduction histidine kinase